MDGKIRTYGKCPTCSTGYQSDGSGPPVCACGVTGGRNVHVLFPWKGKRHWIFCDRQRQGFALLEKMLRMPAWTFAAQTLGTIRSEVVAKTFKPENYASAPPAGYGFEEYSAEWLSRLTKAGRKPSYIATCKGYLDNWLVPALASEDIREIDRPKIWKLHEKLQGATSERTGERLSGKMVSNIMGCLRSLLSDARQVGDRADLPPFPDLPFDAPEYRYYEWDEIDAALSKLHAGDRPIFELLASSPIRPGEARALWIEDLRLDDCMIKIGRTWSLQDHVNRRKSGGTYWVPIEPRIAAMLREMLQARALKLGRPLRADEFVFVTSPKRGRATAGKPYSKDLSSVWRAACRDAGVEYKAAYPLRHSFGHHALDAGASLDEVRDMMGHADRRMTEKYAKRSPEAMRRTLKLVQGSRDAARAESESSEKDA